MRVWEVGASRLFSSFFWPLGKRGFFEACRGSIEGLLAQVWGFSIKCVCGAYGGPSADEWGACWNRLVCGEGGRRFGGWEVS